MDAFFCLFPSLLNALLTNLPPLLDPSASSVFEVGFVLDSFFLVLGDFALFFLEFALAAEVFLLLFWMTDPLELGLVHGFVITAHDFIVITTEGMSSQSFAPCQYFHQHCSFPCLIGIGIILVSICKASVSVIVGRVASGIKNNVTMILQMRILH